MTDPSRPKGADCRWTLGEPSTGPDFKPAMGKGVPHPTRSPTAMLEPGFSRHDPAWPALHRLIERSPRNPVITGKSDQLLDVRVRVIPKLDGIRKIERPPHSHYGIVNEIGTSSTDSTVEPTCRALS